jgi:5-formyltetrahydrofolate cyclo-ligase
VTSLRATLRGRRAALPGSEVVRLSAIIARHLWRLPALTRAERIACYVAVAGEVDCSPVLAEAVARRRRLYLPVLHGFSLLFAPWEPGVAMVRNRFGIPEPARAGARAVSASSLDVVLAPLVAFDDRGHRLGMGGGYYDRALRFLARRGPWRRPLVIGLAYEFQHVAELQAERWDVALHAVVTEAGTRLF